MYYPDKRRLGFTFNVNCPLTITKNYIYHAYPKINLQGKTFTADITTK